MAEPIYQIVVTGQLAPGAQREDVQARVARLFGAPAAKIAPLFTGARVIVKKGLDEAAARRYVAALGEAGLLAVAERMDETVVGDPPAPVTAATLAPAGATLVEAPVITPPAIDTSALSVAAAGGDLVEFTAPAAPAIDTSRLSVAAVGAQLVESPDVPAFDVDLSAFTLDRPGVQLVETAVVVAPAIDTSRLDLAPVGSDVGEQRRTDFPPPPDISHLKLDD